MKTDSWCPDAECLGSEIDPRRRLRVGLVVDWRISEYELHG